MEFSDWDSLEEDEEQQLTKDVELLRKCHCTNGYREGLEEGQHSVLQSSFNDGFSKSVKAYYELGLLKGIVSAIMVMTQQDNSGNEDLLLRCQNCFTTISAIQGINPCVLPPTEPDTSKHLPTANSSVSVKEKDKDSNSELEFILSKFNSVLYSTSTKTSTSLEGVKNLSGGALLTPQACLCRKADNTSCINHMDDFSVDSCTLSKGPELCSNGVVKVPCDMLPIQTCCLQLLRESELDTVT